MSAFYTEAQRGVQDRFDTRRLADRVEEVIVDQHINEMNAAFISSRDFFFLASVDHTGQPTVSYKGGDVGLVTVVDDTTLAFPNYDGNGTFLSMGNVADTGEIGLLFIDLETPNRVRVHARASLHDDDPLLERYPGANLIVRAEVTRAFHNCARYIHKHQRVQASPYVPDERGAQPLPSWKRIDVVQDVVDEEARAATAEAGGTISFGEYVQHLGEGRS